MRSFSHITYCTEYYYYYVFKFNGLIARAISSLERVAIIAVSYYSTFSVQRILPTRLSLGISLKWFHRNLSKWKQSIHHVQRALELSYLNHKLLQIGNEEGLTKADFGINQRWVPSDTV